MFNFLKKKAQQEELVAVVDGELIPIEEVSDPVFSQKMMGDGFGIKSTGNTIYACADATITMLFPSNHAIGLTLDNGMEILIHVGIDTVNENGKGFTCLVEANQKVKSGEPLLKIDREKPTYIQRSDINASNIHNQPKRWCWKNNHRT